MVSLKMFSWKGFFSKHSVSTKIATAFAPGKEGHSLKRSFFSFVILGLYTGCTFRNK